MKTQIILADDHKMMRDGLRSLLEMDGDIEILAQAENGHDVLKYAREYNPNVVLMDIAMPGLNGIEATRQIIAEHSNIKVIALSMHSDRKFVSEMLKAGASGYLLKNCAFEELTDAIDVVMQGQIYLSPSISGTIVENFLRNPRNDKDSAFSQLTARERQILQLLAESNTTKQVARKLFISAKTVETHRSKIMKKLELDNIAALTKYAVREGITSLDE